MKQLNIISPKDVKGIKVRLVNSDAKVYATIEALHYDILLQAKLGKVYTIKLLDGKDFTNQEIKRITQVLAFIGYKVHTLSTNGMYSIKVNWN